LTVTYCVIHGIIVGMGTNFTVLPQYLGSKFAGIPWRWGPRLQYYRAYGVGFTWTVNWCMSWGRCICKFQ